VLLLPLFQLLHLVQQSLEAVLLLLLVPLSTLLDMLQHLE